MDFFGDLLAGLFTPTEPRRGASRVERIIAVVAFVGLVLLVGFVWLVFSGFLAPLFDKGMRTSAAGRSRIARTEAGVCILTLTLARVVAER